MNKIKLITLIALLFLNTIVGQSQKGVVLYKKMIEWEAPSSKDKKNPNFETFEKINRKIDKLLKSTEFKLKIKGKESSFALIPSLVLEQHNLANLALVPYGNCKFYNTKTERLSKENIFGEDFLISDEQLNWQLKTETKKIGSYVCNRAIAIEKKMYKGKMKEYPIIAWYCSEINVPFGPIGVSGLPGLILELNKGNIKYTATKIMLNSKKEVKIEKITKGKRITAKKMSEMISEAMGNFKKNKGY